MIQQFQSFTEDRVVNQTGKIRGKMKGKDEKNGVNYTTIQVAELVKKKKSSQPFNASIPL